MASGTLDTRMALDVISACPALFPCNICSDLAIAWAWSRHFLEESRPLARARTKELSLRDLAAKA